MTPFQAYSAALEAAAKLAEADAFYHRHDGKQFGSGFWQSAQAERMKTAENLAAAIRALPVPEADWDDLRGIAPDATVRKLRDDWV